MYKRKPAIMGYAINAGVNGCELRAERERAYREISSIRTEIHSIKYAVKS